jgi:signal transduction histidine kinase
MPKSLSGRMTLILVAGLLAAQALSLVLHIYSRPGMMGAGGPHPGMMTIGPVPLRFLLNVGLTLAVVTVVALVAVRWATRPLQHLADAATAFADDLDAPPLAASGPAEVRRAAEAFNFMQTRLRQLMAERARALAAVSHDLRTPLTRMRLRVELVDDPELQRRLDADIDAMQSMINGVLAYLRGIEDAEPVQPIRMDALLSSIVDDARALGRDVSLAAVADGTAKGGADGTADGGAEAPPPRPFAGRLSLLRRAVTNLVDNAVTHGGRAIVRLVDDGRALRVVVEDDGPGIPEADLARATEPYVRLDASRSADTGGVGLGLAIVRDAASRHGGRLVLENRDTGGLRAIIELPRQPESTADRAAMHG